MRLLLDTHVWIWLAVSPDRLRPQVREVIASSDDVLVSTVVAWEVAVKQAIGKLDPSLALLEAPVTHAFSELPVTWSHALEMAALPVHHRDPFDRLLVAQARVESLTVVTSDPLITRYDVAAMAA